MHLINLSAKMIIQSLLIFLFSGCGQKQSADLIVIGNIYTMNTDQPSAEAVAIKNGEILFVGSRKTAEGYKRFSTKVFEVPNGMVLPGFIDTHVHLLWGGLEATECDLHDLRSAEDIYTVIRNYIKSRPGEDWVRGGGWEVPVFPGGSPRKEWLDIIEPERPVILYSADGHSAWVNSKSLELAGIDRHTPDPLNGRIDRDPDTAEPSGTLRENAMMLVGKFLPAYSKKQIETGLINAAQTANRFGVTGILDAGIGEIDGLYAYRNLSRSKKVSLRISASQYAEPADWRKDLEKMKTLHFIDKNCRMNTVKLFADGVIEGRTAALLEPYLGTEDRGILNWHPDSMNSAIAAFDKAGFQVHVHAIGDRGIRTTLDAFEYAQDINGPSDKRHMMSHIQLIHPNDQPRFNELGITASFQSLWAYPDDYITQMTIPVLGPQRSEWLYPIGSVDKTGAHITGGSDWTVSSLNPLDAVEVAVTRREPGEHKGDALLPSEAVGLSTMLKAYTIGGAYSLFLEDKVGSIQVGKRADIIFLDRNLFSIPSHEIHSAKVTHTFFDGKLIYEK
jgi:hypothetical protein